MRRTLPSLLALLTFAACSEPSPTRPVERSVCEGPAASASPAPAPPEPLDPIFAAAGAEFDVPPALLAAIGYVETRWQMVEGRADHARTARSGVMALGEPELSTGAALAGVSVQAARSVPAANVRAAAALLDAWATEAGIERSDLGAWAPVVARYSGIELPAGRSAYVHRDVFAVLRRGVSVRGVATIAATGVDADFPRLSVSGSGAAADYAAAVWRPSPNANRRPAGDRVAIVIIHSCEGAYTGCWSWLANPQSGVSAHYVVREDGSEITQLVPEADRAWHIGARYDCTLNAGFDCQRNGQQSNDFTIGVEHGGYASQTVWPVEQIDASARLVCDVTRRQGIPRDRIRIVSHAQLQPYNRTDPGAHWPWADYMARIDRHCGGSGPEVRDTLVVDQDGGVGRDRGYLTLSSGWTAASATPGFLGSGYHFASTRADVADPATFHFFLAAPASRTVEARWTAGGNRSPQALFQVTASDGRELARVTVDQQRGGGAWNSLGTWSFPAGWNQVHLSRLGPAGCVVIADAIRVTG